MSETDVARGFLASAEYQGAHASPTAYLFGLYADVLGRAPDRDGLDGWQQAVRDGLSREGLADDFLRPPERYRQLLAQDYAAYLGREPDAPGEAGWLDALQGGRLSPAQVAQAVLASDEFFAASSR
jgi:hypothetical protein